MVTVLPASRWRPVTVSLVPPETGPFSGRTRLKLGLWGMKRRKRRKLVAHYITPCYPRLQEHKVCNLVTV